MINPCRILLAPLLLVCSLLAVTPAAFGVSLGFDLTFTHGLLMGQTFPGQMEITPGEGEKLTYNGTLTAFRAIVDGVQFSEQHGPPLALNVFIFGNELYGIDYVSSLNGLPKLGIWLFPEVDLPGNIVTYFDSAGEWSGGYVSRVYAVPEPAMSLAAVTASLGLLAATRRSRRE